MRVSSNYDDNPRIRKATLFPVCRFYLSHIYRGREEGYAAPLNAPSWANQLDSARFVPEEQSQAYLKLYHSRNFSFLLNLLISLRAVRLCRPRIVFNATLLRSWRQVTNSKHGTHTKKRQSMWSLEFRGIYSYIYVSYLIYLYYLFSGESRWNKNTAAVPNNLTIY